MAAATEQEPVQRLDGPLRDPDVVRVYGEAFSPCLRVTVALRSRGELVALLSHCYRSDALAQLLDIALRDGEERLGIEVLADCAYGCSHVVAPMVEVRGRVTALSRSAHAAVVEGQHPVAGRLA